MKGASTLGSYRLKRCRVCSRARVVGYKVCTHRQQSAPSTNLPSANGDNQPPGSTSNGPPRRRSGPQSKRASARPKEPFARLLFEFSNRGRLPLSTSTNSPTSSEALAGLFYSPSLMMRPSASTQPRKAISAWCSSASPAAKLRSACLSITDHEANRIIEVNVDLQGKRRIKLHWRTYLVSVGPESYGSTKTSMSCSANHLQGRASQATAQSAASQPPLAVREITKIRIPENAEIAQTRPILPASERLQLYEQAATCSSLKGFSSTNADESPRTFRVSRDHVDVDAVGPGTARIRRRLPTNSNRTAHVGRGLRGSSRPIPVRCPNKAASLA
jgi:hypothetical protein